MIAFATKGAATNDETRLRALISHFNAEVLAFDKARKLASFRSLLGRLASTRGQLIVMEGTGIAGGAACMLGRLLWGHRYVVSSGDAVGPFIGSHHTLLGPVFGAYERLLCRFASGFIGWTPYLVGRAMTFGTRRGVTAPGWVLGGGSPSSPEERRQLRESWGINDDDIVYGLLGALIWNRRRGYCYGMELVRAVKQVAAENVKVVVVGDGTGRDRLAKEAGGLLGSRVILPGPVPFSQAVSTLSAFDVASLPQSTDPVGAFRYTTKLCEYLIAGLPVVTSRIPVAYDLDHGKIWRLPGDAPWEDTYIQALADLMAKVQPEDLVGEKADISTDVTFDRDLQIKRVGTFLAELKDDLGVG